MSACRASCSATSRSATRPGGRTTPSRRPSPSNSRCAFSKRRRRRAPRVQSPLRWSASPDWKLDFSNIARLSPEEIARRRAEFDRQKEIAKTITHQAGGSRIMPHLTTDDGVRLYYEEAGSGYPVVFVHEFAGDYRSYETQLRYFARRYRCVAFNARGYPPSDVPEDLQRIRRSGRATTSATCSTGLGIAKAHVVGISMGGFAVLHFGFAYPERASVAGRRRLRLWRAARQAPAIRRGERRAPRRRSKAAAWPRSARPTAPARPACSCRTRTRAAMPSSSSSSASIRRAAPPIRSAACRARRPSL